MSPLFLLLITAHLCIIKCYCYAQTGMLFPAILVLGDSTVDTGNNNYIVTPFKGDHPPYGRDFPGRVPTGRFSDGKLVPDIVASMIGLKETVPPFLDPNLSDQDIVTGVSFASAGSGYDDLTSSLSRVIPMSKQPAYLKNYIRRLNDIVGGKEARSIVARALVIISAGTNDFVFNYYDIPTRRSIQFTIQDYQNFLLNNLEHLVKQVYDVGCRSMVVSGLPPIGCLPLQTTIKSPIVRSCSWKENADAESYNGKLQKVLERLEGELPGSTILYVDVYNPVMDMINNPLKYVWHGAGLVEARRGCCGTGLVEAGPLCTRFTPVCSNPSRYLFFDSIHPTQSTYNILSHNLFHLLLPNLSHSHIS
ncbi:hypothetical protein ACS0TY_007971 [Phlomoides rotata]